MRMLTDRTVGISIVYGEEEIAKEEGGGIGIDEEDRKSDLLGDRVVVGIQRLLESVERIQVFQPGVVTLDGKVVGEVG